MYLCGFVCRRCVAGANKVEGTMSWLLGTNEILASKHDIAALKVKQGHFETAILVLHNFVIFYYGWRCLEAEHLNIFIIQTRSSVMQLFEGSYFSVASGWRHLRPNSAIVNGPTYVNYILAASKLSTKKL